MFTSSIQQIESKLKNKTEKNKMRLTLVSVPFMGHCKILMNLAKTLMKQNPNLEINFVITGWKDIQMNSSDMQQLSDCGIHVIPLSDDENIQGSAPMKFTFPRVVKLTDAVIEASKNSDFIIYDFFSPEGYIAGKQLAIPSICSMPAIMGPFDRQNTLFQQGLLDNANYFKSILEKYQIDLSQNCEMVSDGFYIPSEYQNIIWTWPGFMQEEPNSACFLTQRKYTDSYVFMRLDEEKPLLSHSVVQSAKDWRNQGKKVIYVSLGTVVTKNLWDHEESVKEFVNMIFNSITKKYANCENYEVIVSTGRPVEDIPAFKHIPHNFHVYETVPQAELLNEVDVFVTHAGGNSVNDAIDARTPMVAIPFFGDQHVCAEYIARKRIGISFLHEKKDRQMAINTQAKLFSRHSLTEDTLVNAIETVLHDDNFKNNIASLKIKAPVNQESFSRALKNRKVLDWKEGDLLYGCTPDRHKFADLAMLKKYFQIGDMRAFSQLFPSQEGKEILPRIVDQYHDVLTKPDIYKQELKQSSSKIYQQTLQEYEKFLREHPKYLQPIGDLDQVTPDKGRAYLETLWNMCLGGLEFFTTIKQHTIHFMVGMFNDKYNEAPIRELEWIRQNWGNEWVRKHVKFYTIHHGCINLVDPVAMNWFATTRPTPALIDVAPEKANLTQAKWNQFKHELEQKAQQINPHLFFNHLKPLYNKELITFNESKLSIIDVKSNPELAKLSLESGDVYIYALLPKEGLRVVKKNQGNSKISHAVVANNKDVICSGEVRLRTILVNGKKQEVLDISNDSGHYMPDTKGLPQVIKAFENLNMIIHRVTGVNPKVRESFDRVEQEMHVSLTCARTI